MHRWLLWVSCAGVVGCTRPNPAFGEEGGTAGDVTSASAASTSFTTSNGSSSTVSDATGEDGSTARTDEGEGSTVGATVGAESGSSSDTGVNPNECWDSRSWALTIAVHKDGVDVGPCGSSINITGPVVVAEGGYFEVEHCGGCDPCGGTTYSFELSVAPATNVYDPTLPGCVNVVTSPGAEMIAPDVCATAGIVIRTADANVDPFYIGSAGELVPPIAAPLAFDFDLVETPMTCECRGMCCLMQPGLYRLAFPGAGVLGIDEGDSVTVPVGLNQVPYQFSNLGSHIHPNCSDRPHVDYVVRRAG